MYNDYISNIDLIDGLNIQTIPLEVGNEITTTKWLMAMQKKLNDIINMRNNMLKDSTTYTDEVIKAVQEEIEKIQNGDYLKDGSIGFDKLNGDLDTLILEKVQERIENVAKMVIFYLDDDGHFCADIPSNWDFISFSSDIDGHLILEY